MLCMNWRLKIARKMKEAGCNLCIDWRLKIARKMKEAGCNFKETTRTART